MKDKVHRLSIGRYSIGFSFRWRGYYHTRWWPPWHDGLIKFYSVVFGWFSIYAGEPEGGYEKHRNWLQKHATSTSKNPVQWNGRN